MKIKKHLLAWGLVAGLVAVASTGMADTPRLTPEARIGFLAVELMSEDDEDNGLAQAVAQGGGAAGGGLAAVWLGAKIGGKIGALIGGPVGVIGGAAIGAA